MKWYHICLICCIVLFIWLVLSIIFYRHCFKRLYDFLLSSLAFIVLSPLLLVLIIINSIVLKGNPFFVQLRPGKINKKNNQERIFKLIKLKTMSDTKDENGNLLPDAQRLNKFGLFLRKTSLDELFSLINIIKGDLSIVGPRPQLVKDMVFMTDEQRKRHTVRQGLTGLAQVNGRNNITWEQKFVYDLEYIKHITFFGDIKIILKTILKVFKQEDINREGTMSDLDFGDYLLKEGKISKEEYQNKQSQAKLILDKLNKKV